MYRVVFILILGFFLSSCKGTVKELEFRRIDNPEIKNWSLDFVQVEAKCIMYNPNVIGVDIDKLIFDVMINDRLVANIDQTVQTTMKGESEFSVPLSFSFSPNKVYKDLGMSALEIGMEILTNRNVVLQFHGGAKVSKGVLHYTVPIKDDIKLSF